MFLCSRCFDGEPPLWRHRSFGRCEECGEVAACVDVQSVKVVNSNCERADTTTTEGETT